MSGVVLTEKQRQVLGALVWLGASSDPPELSPPHPAARVHSVLELAYFNGGQEFLPSVDTIRDQLRRLVAKRLVLKRKAGYVISAPGRRALEA